MELTPVDYTEPVRDPKDPTESHEAGGRVFIANEWAVLTTDETYRLAVGDARQGKLHWKKGEETTHLADLMTEQEGQGWSSVADWSVSPSGKRLWCIAGRFKMATKKHYWSSGRFYRVDIETNEVTLIYEPVVRTDRELRQVAALGEDDVLMMSARALRWFRNDSELTRLRIKDGDRMAVGMVDDRRLALVKAGGPSLGTTCTLLVEISGAKLTKLGEILVPIHDICFHEGRPLVKKPDGSWHEVTVPAAATKPSKARKKASKTRTPKHPLEKAMLEAVRVDPPVRPVTDEIRELIDSRCPDPIRARMCGPDIAAGIHREGTGVGELVVVKAGKEIARIKAPNAIRFEVTADGKRAFILGQGATSVASILSGPGSSKSVHEWEIGTSKEWKPITVDGSGFWGPDAIACFDEDHLVVKSDKSLELIIRDGDIWKATHRVKCPRRRIAPLLPRPRLRRARQQEAHPLRPERRKAQEAHRNQAPQILRRHAPQDLVHPRRTPLRRRKTREDHHALRVGQVHF